MKKKTKWKELKIIENQKIFFESGCGRFGFWWNADDADLADWRGLIFF